MGIFIPKVSHCQKDDLEPKASNEFLTQIVEALDQLYLNFTVWIKERLHTPTTLSACKWPVSVVHVMFMYVPIPDSI